MEHKLVFDSSKFPQGEIVGLASGYLSLTTIEFVSEGILVNVEAKTGEVDFYDFGGKKLLSFKKEIRQCGDEKLSDLKCLVEDGQIKLGFPIYSYKDNYPNCDGESDRWTKTISSFEFISYDIKNNCIVK